MLDAAGADIDIDELVAKVPDVLRVTRDSARKKGALRCFIRVTSATTVFPLSYAA